MHVTPLHAWDLSPAEAIRLQSELAQRLICDRPLDLNTVRLVAGVDVSVKNEVSQAAVVVLSLPDLAVVETVTARRPTPFPYIPGLLSFREGPVLVEAFQRLETTPDVFIFDGMGRAHPRRIGIAAHLGLWIERPTIGCGKTRLIGQYAEPAHQRGSFSHLLDHDELIGVVLRTKAGVKPVYISVGHLADLDTSIELILRCTTRCRLPEPIRAAHHAAGILS